MTETPAFEHRYRLALTAYVDAPGETGRSEAYLLGRQAVTDGLGLLELAVVHEHAVRSVRSGAPRADVDEIAMEFFLEALSNFDMAQRGYLEAQASARVERRQVELLSRLNQAVVALASVTGYAERVDAVVELSAMLVAGEPSAAGLFVDDGEWISAHPATDVTPDLRKAAANARTTRRTSLGPAAGSGWVLATPMGGPPGAQRGGLALWQLPAFSDEEVAVVEQFARYASMALDMASRFEQEHELAVNLQRALLPPAPQPVPGIHVAWRYVAAESRDIGGDWYDLLSTEKGEAVLVVGDVTGHDLRAAAIMGQLRLALQADVIDGHPPIEVLDRADRLLQRLHPDRMATVVYAVIDSDRRTLALSNAGHPPPILVSPDGTVTLMTTGRSVPLGVDAPGGRRRQATYALEPGATLILYTDGLIEDRAHGLEAGLERLMVALRAAAGEPETICEVALSIRRGVRSDDVCVLCARIE
jgi:hypothetical protein